MTNEHGTPRTIHFGALLFGDRFRFAGDTEGTSYAPVKRSQMYGDSHAGVDLADGTSHYGSCFKKIVLLHRAPNCECGVHVDYCEADCGWPDELEDLWHSIFRSGLT